jgi:hypothetical protein
MYINAVEHSVKLQLNLLYDFYITNFKIKYKFYIASGSVPPPPVKALGAYLNKGKVFPVVFDC